MTPLINPIPQKPSYTGENGKYQLQRLLPRHFRMVELHLAGLKNIAIAETLGCTAQSVGIVLRSPIVQKEIQTKMRDQSHGNIADTTKAYDSKVMGILERSSVRAAQTLDDLMQQSDDDSIKLRASTSILDRAIGKPESKNAGEGAVLKIEIDTKQATLLMLALTESKEHSNAQDAESTTDRQNANSEITQCSQLCEETEQRPRVRYRKAKAQASDAGRQVTNGKEEAQEASTEVLSRSNVKFVENLNGGKDTPPTK